MNGSLLATLVGVGLGLFVCSATCVICRIWRRNRYYRKVQRSLDEEEAAFQETLARNYQEETQLDAEDKEKLQMLESYMMGAEHGDNGLNTMEEGAPLPTDGSANGRLYRRAEDVDKFMNDLAAAASGSSAARQEAS